MGAVVALRPPFCLGRIRRDDADPQPSAHAPKLRDRHACSLSVGGSFIHILPIRVQCARHPMLRDPRLQHPGSSPDRLLLPRNDTTSSPVASSTMFIRQPYGARPSNQSRKLPSSCSSPMCGLRSRRFRYALHLRFRPFPPSPLTLPTATILENLNYRTSPKANTEKGAISHEAEQMFNVFA
jgi:hypothetical protein